MTIRHRKKRPINTICLARTLRRSHPRLTWNQSMTMACFRSFYLSSTSSSSSSSSSSSAASYLVCRRIRSKKFCYEWLLRGQTPLAKHLRLDPVLNPLLFERQSQVVVVALILNVDPVIKVQSKENDNSEEMIMVARLTDFYSQLECCKTVHALATSEERRAIKGLARRTFVQMLRDLIWINKMSRETIIEVEASGTSAHKPHSQDKLVSYYQHIGFVEVINNVPIGTQRAHRYCLLSTTVGHILDRYMVQT